MFILEYFAFGTFLFWGLFFFLFIAALTATERDGYNGWCTFWTLVFFGVLVTSNFGSIQQLDWRYVVVVLLAYFPVGAGWSLYRWRKHCRKFVKRFKDNPGSYVYLHEPHQSLDLKAALLRAWQLQPSENTTKLTGWIAFWPFSMLWYLVADFVESIYDALVRQYEKIRDSAIAGT